MAPILASQRAHCMRTARPSRAAGSFAAHRLAPARAIGRHATVTVSAALNPPTVSETKRKFIESYSKPIPALYNTVVQELLVQQHFCRYNVNYQYDAVYALGFVSVFDQILDEYDATERAAIFAAYIKALGEDPARYRKDAEALEGLASSSEAIVPDASGTELQKALAEVADRIASGKFAYSKYFAIGLFRLLELTGAKEPAALEKLVTAVGVRADLVNKDLMLYKGILSKLSVAKELFRDFLEREKKKQAEREAAKATTATDTTSATDAGAEAPVA